VAGLECKVARSPIERATPLTSHFCRCLNHCASFLLLQSVTKLFKLVVLFAPAIKQDAVETADFAPGAATGRTRRSMRFVFESGLFGTPLRWSRPQRKARNVTVWRTDRHTERTHGDSNTALAQRRAVKKSWEGK